MVTEVIKVEIQPSNKSWQDHAKFGMEIATPIITLIIGICILRLTKKFERSQWRSQKLIEKRITEWDTLRPELNDIFCFCTHVGGWKSLTPVDIIKLKRKVDKKIHLARPYFSQSFFQAYVRFIGTCFAQYQGHAVDAKIKSLLWEHQNAHKEKWDSSWDDLFHDESSTDEAIVEAYESFLKEVTEELETRMS